VAEFLEEKVCANTPPPANPEITATTATNLFMDTAIIGGGSGPSKAFLRVFPDFFDSLEAEFSERI
jgi:hypothetical protein